MKLFSQAFAVFWIALVPLAAQGQTVPQSQGEITLSFAPLVKKAAPAVVNIFAKRVVRDSGSPVFGNPFFEQFFRDFGAPSERVQNALGSGVILSADGLVVSNYHVVGGATDIRVALSDRREYAARIVLADEQSDLAVLRLEGASGLPYLALRPSDGIEVGELVLAIGNPFGIGQTVSSGIVSGLARSSISLGRGYFIQTDAPVNPGNSGGALIDVSGRLLGINTAIISSAGGSNGVGFAIPADLVAQFRAQAEAGGSRFVRPWAGVGGQSVDAQMAEALGLDRPEGVVLNELHADSPFRKAGLQSGDVVLSLAGIEVNSPQEVMFRMAVAGIGSTLSLRYLRGGAEAETVVALLEAPESPDRAALTVTEGGLAGLSVANINPAVIAEMELALQAEGVVVTGLQGVLTRSGLAPGDILLGINGEPVTTTADVKTLAQSGGRRWTIDALRDGQRLRLAFRL